MWTAKCFEKGKQTLPEKVWVLMDISPASYLQVLPYPFTWLWKDGRGTIQGLPSKNKENCYSMTQDVFAGNSLQWKLTLPQSALQADVCGKCTDQTLLKFQTWKALPGMLDCFLLRNIELHTCGHWFCPSCGLDRSWHYVTLLCCKHCLAIVPAFSMWRLVISYRQVVICGLTSWSLVMIRIPGFSATQLFPQSCHGNPHICIVGKDQPMMVKTYGLKHILLSKQTIWHQSFKDMQVLSFFSLGNPLSLWWTPQTGPECVEEAKHCF